MIYTGLVSVTFRKLNPRQIVNLVSKAGLQGIEWGGDVHVPVGDIKNAREVLKVTEDKGLKVAAYGSYYKFNDDNTTMDNFKNVLETAAEINAPTIRVWAGSESSIDADEYYWSKIVNNSIKAAEEAKKAKMSISYEFHNNTLTDTNETAYRLLKETNRDNINIYWQQNLNCDFEVQKQGLKLLLPKITNIHVFNWIKKSATAFDLERLTLQEGSKSWREILEVFSNIEHDKKINHYAMLEFIKDDSKEQFIKDAAILKELIGKCSEGRLEI